jgi:hypothetical protein
MASGQKTGSSIGPLTSDLIFSTEKLVEIPIVIDTAARDAGNTGNTTYLREGLVLAPVTATGKYKEFDTNNSDGTEISANLVILGYDVLDIDDGDASAMAYSGGDFKSAGIIVDPGSAAPTWADVQRINRH